jgi:hypothetical protein
MEKAHEMNCRISKRVRQIVVRRSIMMCAWKSSMVL